MPQVGQHDGQGQPYIDGLRWLPYLCPGFNCQEVQHPIFFHHVIQLITLTLKYWATPVPTHMARPTTGHAAWVLLVHAVSCAVVKGTGATGVMLCRAIPHILLQEPNTNSYGNTKANKDLRVVYPSSWFSDALPPCTVILINVKLNMN